MILDKRLFAGYRECATLAEWIFSAWTCLGMASWDFRFQAQRPLLLLFCSCRPKPLGPARLRSAGSIVPAVAL
jgi:hypothetical protein